MNIQTIFSAFPYKKIVQNAFIFFLIFSLWLIGFGTGTTIQYEVWQHGYLYKDPYWITLQPIIVCALLSVFFVPRSNELLPILIFSLPFFLMLLCFQMAFVHGFHATHKGFIFGVLPIGAFILFATGMFVVKDKVPVIVKWISIFLLFTVGAWSYHDKFVDVGAIYDVYPEMKAIIFMIVSGISFGLCALAAKTVAKNVRVLLLIVWGCLFACLISFPILLFIEYWFHLPAIVNLPKPSAGFGGLNYIMVVIQSLSYFSFAWFYLKLRQTNLTSISLWLLLYPFIYLIILIWLDFF